MTKNYLLALFLSIGFFASPIGTNAQTVAVTVTVAGQTISGGNYEFDLYLHSTANAPLYLGTSDFIFTYDETQFTSPAITEVTPATTYCTFVPNVSAQATLCQNNYYGALDQSLSGSEIRINLNLPDEPANTTEFNDNIAEIDGSTKTHRLGRFQISGVNATDASDVALAWKSSGADLISQVFHFENTGDFLLEETTETWEIDSDICNYDTDYESDWGRWIDGGANCRRILDASSANSGTYSVQLRGKGSSSLMTTEILDLSSASQIDVDFSYITKSFEGSEDFWLQISTDGGSTYTTVEDWVKGVDFANNERHDPSVIIPGPFTATTKLRFRCDAIQTNDLVYIDDVNIDACGGTLYSLTTSTIGQGSLTTDPMSATYIDGTSVIMTATPAAGWTFDSWSGDLTGSNNPVSITMDANKSITANFVLNCNYDTDYESDWGRWIDGGANCRRILDASSANSGTYSVQLRGKGSSSLMTTEILDLSSASQIDVDFSYITKSFEGSEDFWLQISTDGGSTYTTVEDWVKGVDFANNERHDPSVIIPGPFTATTKLRFRCDAIQTNDLVYIDDVNIDACGGTLYSLTTSTVGQGSLTTDPMSATYIDGTSVIMTATPAAGWTFDSWSGDLTGSNNPVSITMDANKSITANFVLSCNYDTDYEPDWGRWIDGGANCRRILDASFANSGTYSVQLRGKGSSSLMTTEILDFSSASQINVDFSYITKSFEGSEDFWLQISTDGGSTYTTVEDWVKGVDFANNERHDPSVIIPGPFTATTKLRFRCDAIQTNDLVYIDDVNIDACTTTSPIFHEDISTRSKGFDNLSSGDVLVYPNPVSGTGTGTGTGTIFIKNTYDEQVRFVLFDVTGKLVKDIFLEPNSTENLNLGRIASGILIYKIETSQELKSGKLIVQ